MNDDNSGTALGRSPFFFASRAKAQKAIVAHLVRVDGKIPREAPEAAATEALWRRRLPALPSPIEEEDGSREFAYRRGEGREREAMAGLGGGL